MADYRRKPGERVGLNWRVPPLNTRRPVRHVVFDTNFWKSFVYARLSARTGDPGALSLFGRKPERHRLLAEHLTAEHKVTTEGRGRTVEEWKLSAAGRDNHWLDCLVGSAVAASMSGAILFWTDAKPRQRKRVRLSELQAAKSGGSA